MNSPTQPTPDALSTQQENELICEKLLGWIKGTFEGTSIRRWDHDGKLICGPAYGWTPSFDTWADAGLILDEMAARGYSPKVGVAVPGKWYGVNPLGEASYAATGPLAVRAAALEYIKAAT